MLLITTCTARKSRCPTDELLLRNAKSFDDWISRLEGDEVERIPAGELYQGDNVRQPMTATGSRRVVSAGWGLLRWSSPVPPYSATFQRSHVDSVARLLPTRDWWNRLCETGHGLGQLPPNTPILLAASEAYLRAMEDDLLPLQNRLHIISAGCSDLGDLTSNLLPADASLQPAVGGPLSSLNTRLAVWLLRQGACDPREAMVRLRAETPPQQKPKRAEISDAKIAAFIRQNAAVQTLTPMLRRLRDSGYACGQERFARIYSEV